MNKNLLQFRVIDLVVFSVLSLITTFMGEYIHLRMPGAGYYLSFAMLIAIIAMVRWGMIGAVTSVVGSFVMVVLGANSIGVDIIMYPIASVFLFGAGYLYNKIDRDVWVNDSIKLFWLVLLAFVALTIGKSFGLLILGESFLPGGAMFFLSQLFNIVITYVVLLIVRRKDGLLVNMYKYFEGHYVEDAT